MIGEHDIEQLRACLPDVLRERCGVVDLRRPFRCPSPEHEDRGPSAHYYERGHTVHCFGCGGTWDAFSLIGAIDGIDGFPEQVKAVAGIVGYSLDDGGGIARPAPRPRAARPAFDVPREAGGTDCYEAIGLAFGNLYAPGNEVGRRWLRYRCLDDDDAAKWGLGFTREPKSIMPEFRVYEPEALGFITIPFFHTPECDSTTYCMLRTISRGEVRNKEWRPAGVATPLWNEWMLHSGLGSVFVTEGLLDAMSLAKIVPDANVMALGGTSNAKRFAQVLFHSPPELRPKKVCVCMDEDDAGHAARDKICSDLDRLGIAHYAMPAYPAGCKDANDLLALLRGQEWDFEERDGGPVGTLYYTRWRN